MKCDNVSMKSNEEYADSIYNIVKDYRNEEGIFITTQTILEWAEQFGDDANFILMEVAHLMPKVYFSKDKVKDYLSDVIDFFQKEYKYSDWDSFLKDADILQLQPERKSQWVLRNLLDEIIRTKVGKCLADYALSNKKHYLYIDDILATGGTIGKDLTAWLKADNHDKSLEAGRITLHIAVICLHNLGWSMQKFKLGKIFGDSVAKRIIVVRCFEVENNLNLYKPKLNAAIPIRDYVSKDIIQYYENIDASKNAHQAFRSKYAPVKEDFFSSPEDRVRYENILLEKGLYIMKQSTVLNTNVRPLGIMSPYHKMLGLGTHFITWRNIPNNCPLVFWWNVPAHNWKPLFEPRR